MPSSLEAYGIFAPHLPQVARDHYDRLPKRKCQGIVPDLLVTCRPRPKDPCRPLLAAVKTLLALWTQHVSGVGGAVPGSQEACGADTRGILAEAAYVGSTVVGDCTGCAGAGGD